MKTLFTNEERKKMREEMNYSRPTHFFEDSVNWNHTEKFGTNANGTRYKK